MSAYERQQYPKKPNCSGFASGEGGLVSFVEAALVAFGRLVGGFGTDGGTAGIVRPTTDRHLGHLAFWAVDDPVSFAPQCVQEKTLVSSLMETPTKKVT